MTTWLPSISLGSLGLILLVTLAACSSNAPSATPTSGGATTASLPTLAQALTETDRDALVALYNATNGPRWSNNEGWLSDDPIHQWLGVSAFENLRVGSLILTDNQLSGEIPPELSYLSSLRRLHLDENELSGGIPSELGSLANLIVLQLHRNQLSGVIPLELGNLDSLERLELYRNQLSGEIPSELSLSHKSAGIPRCTL